MKCSCNKEADLVIHEAGFEVQPVHTIYHNGKPICCTCVDEIDFFKGELIIC